MNSAKPNMARVSPRQRFCLRVARTLCCATLLLTASIATAADCRIQQVGGISTLVIDGQPHTGLCYSTYDASSPNLQQRVERFSQAGCNIFNFVVEISGYGYSRPLWPERDRWDFTDLDDRAHRILQAAPHALLLPRIYIDAPAWWRDEHPQEMMVLDNGAKTFGKKLFALSRPDNFPSLASHKWRQDMQFALRTILQHIEQSDYADHVIGYQLSGQKTEEWYHWSMNCQRLGDYSEHMQRAFCKWLETKYSNDAQLQQAWQRPDVTIATAQIPTLAQRIGDRSHTFRQLPQERPVIDFHTFWSDIMADTIELFAHTVKQQTGGTKIVGAFYAYTFEFADLAEDAGHLALYQLLRSPHIDFIMAPSSYFNRNLPGKPFFRAPTTSFTLHGKLFWNDFDQVSYKYFDKLKADPNLKTWEWQMGLTRTAEEFVWMNCREIGMTLTHGIQTAHFDIHGGYYDDPEIMHGVMQLADIRQRAIQDTERSSRAEILLVVDEQSPHYLRFRNPAEQPSMLLRSLLSAQVAEMGFVAPYDSVLLSDLEKLDTRPYKLVLMLNTFHIDTAQRQLIQQRLLANDRTIIWFYAPGYFDQQGANPENMERLSGMRIQLDTPPAPGAAAILKDGLVDPPARLPLLNADLFFVDDPRVEVWGTRSDAPQSTVLARRPMNHWTSIYSATAPLPAALLKRVATDAGVHIYNANSNHLLYANRHYLMIGAGDQAEEATLQLPRSSTVTDAMTQKIVGLHVDQFTIPLRPKEVRLFRLQ